MNAIPSTIGTRGSSFAKCATLDASTVAMRWSALNEAASVVATLAGIPANGRDQRIHDVSDLIRECPAWRRELAESGIADLAAIMEPGLKALLAVNSRAGDPRPAATALWQEYSKARAAVLELLDESEV